MKLSHEPVRGSSPADWARAADALTKMGAEAGSATREGALALLSALGRTAKAGSAEKKADLQSAKSKLARGAELLLALAEGKLTDESLRLMLAQGEQDQSGISQSTSDVKRAFAKAQEKTLRRLEQLTKSIDAKKNASFWSKLLKVFKVVATALSAAAAVVTGGALAIAAAALLVAALVVDHVPMGSAGKWLSLGLSLAAAALTLGSSFAGSSSSFGKLFDLGQKVGKALKLGLGLGSAGANAAAATAGLVKSGYDADALDAEAMMQQLKAEIAKALSQADEEREAVERLLNKNHSAMLEVLGVLKADHEYRLANIKSGPVAA